MIPDDGRAHLGWHEVTLTVESGEGYSSRDERFVPAVFIVIRREIAREPIVDDFFGSTAFPGVEHVRWGAGTQFDRLFGLISLSIDTGAIHSDTVAVFLIPFIN